MADRVLVTGISGFLGGHVALALLQAGFEVRGSVRSLDRAAKVRETLGRAGGDVAHLDFVELDLLADKGWSAAMDGCRYLQHVASPFVSRMPEDKMDLIRPAVEGTERALNAALASGIERVVLTSSVAAIQYGHDPVRTAPFTAADWTNLEGRGVNAYVESKTRAERRAWEIMDAAGRHDDLAVINPAGILGPLLDEDPGTSAEMVARLLKGGVPAAPRISFAIVDVRDIAALQVAAMQDPAAGGQRFPAGLGPASVLDLARILRVAYPDRAGRLPRFAIPDWVVRLVAVFDSQIRSNLGELGVIKRVDSSAAERLLGRPLLPIQTAALATASTLVSHGLV